MSLLEIPREPTRCKIKVEVSDSVLADFDAFVEFAKTEQAHATRNNVLEYILDDFFRCSRKEVSMFHDWCETRTRSQLKEDPSARALSLDMRAKSQVREDLDERGERPAPHIREHIRIQRMSRHEHHETSLKEKPADT